MKRISLLLALIMIITTFAGCQGASKHQWTYGQVEFGGAGFVNGLIATSEENLFYARTDVGGAYRWDDSIQRWVSLNYWVSNADKGLMGIDGIAADPKAPQNVYMLAGTDYFSNGKTAILKSNDYGVTVEVIDVSDLIRVHGNGMGRGNGERIAVDPFNSDMILAGGRTGGMIISLDGGDTWEKLESFPVDTTPNKVGINCILFDPEVEGKIYASVSRSGDENIFVSLDSGKSWTPFENAYLDMMPQRMKFDPTGALYVVYSDTEGPHGQTKGDIYRYENGTATSIKPGNHPFGDIVIDPTNPDRLLACTGNTWSYQAHGGYGDIFYVSTDRGESWVSINEKLTMSTNGMDWIADCSMHWCSSLIINPFNPNQIMVDSGNGIFACDNIWDETPDFYFNSRGLEECVPLDALSIEGMPFIVAIGDYDGFMTDDVTKPALRFLDKIGTTVSITVPTQKTEYISKLGGGNEQKLTYSTDGGKTWNWITNSPDPSKTFAEGTIAFNADGSRLIWSSGTRDMVYYTEDFGETWVACEGIFGSDSYLIGDANNPNYVYAICDDIKVSSDGGKSFESIPDTAFIDGHRITVDPKHEGVFYIATNTGLYKFSDYGKVIERIESVESAEAVGIGKPKNEGDPMVLFAFGKFKGHDFYGAHMSEDGGKTWSAVTDEMHQFGGMSNGFIIGDINKYGRCYITSVGLGVIYCDIVEDEDK